MFTCSTRHLFLYPVHADVQRCKQRITFTVVSLDVLAKLWSSFSQIKQLECHCILPPQEVQCVHMYSLAWDALYSLLYQSLCCIAGNACGELNFAVCCFGGNSQTLYIHPLYVLARISIVFSKPLTLNPQTSCGFHCKSQNKITASISGYTAFDSVLIMDVI